MLHLAKIIFVTALSLSLLLGGNLSLAAVELRAGEALYRGDHLESENSDFRFYLQNDGNLVVRHQSTGVALWSSKTHGQDGVRLVMQRDGNLVLYTEDAKPLWSSKTHGTDINRFELTNNGSLNLTLESETKLSLFDSEAYECVGDTLNYQQTLKVGQRLCDGACSMGIDRFKNFGVWFDSPEKSDEFWSTGWDLDIANQARTFTLQSDGNVVLYARKQAPLWATGTADSSAINAKMKLYQSGRFCEVFLNIEDEWGPYGAWEASYDD